MEGEGEGGREEGREREGGTYIVALFSAEEKGEGRG